ncbi:hypothetical protein D1007_06166 [Hordeum vulgare]|nr:hypothetical protein D1007_06166 [Hordeum vulgare]
MAWKFCCHDCCTWFRFALWFCLCTFGLIQILILYAIVILSKQSNMLNYSSVMCYVSNVPHMLHIFYKRGTTCASNVVSIIHSCRYEFGNICKWFQSQTFCTVLVRNEPVLMRNESTQLLMHQFSDLNDLVWHCIDFSILMIVIVPSVEF